MSHIGNSDDINNIGIASIDKQHWYLSVLFNWYLPVEMSCFLPTI